MEPLYKQVKNYPNKWYNNGWWLLFWMIMAFPVGFFGLWKSDIISTGIKAVISIVFVGWVLSLISESPAYQNRQSIETAPAVQPALSTPKYDPPTNEFSSRWSYSESEDRMTSANSYYASITADDRINFEFPYNGGSVFTLTIRKSKGRNEVLLQCDKCQFIHSYSGDNTIQVKFDSGSPQTYSFNEAADGSSDIIFIGSTKRFIDKLKKSNHLLIGADFYQAGTRYIDFSVKGFEWK